MQRAGRSVSWEFILGGAAVFGLAVGGTLLLVGSSTAGNAVLAASSAVILVPLVWSVARSLLRGDVGVDGIALVAIAAALVLGEYLVAAVIAVMLAGGNALEASADRRARRELTALVERMPKFARRRDGETVTEVPVEAVEVGDLVVIGSGEIVPVDGEITTAEALIDESTLTGEPLPATHRRGDPVRSGVANAGAAFEIRTTRPAAASAYAALVRLVEAAGQQRAPFVRVADRYAAYFLPFALGVAGIAWAVSGDPVRALAVLVVATPCPLILAAPIALVAGVSRAASIGVVIKGAGVIERLGEARSVLLDKTGTVTVGAPTVGRIHAAGSVPADEMLRLAASLDQLSAHTVARALVHEAQNRELALHAPQAVVERPGAGIEGQVDGRRVEVGNVSWLRDRGYDGDIIAGVDDLDGVAVAVDGAFAGVIGIGDPLRPDAADLVPALRRAGIRHVALATGDHRARADEIGAALGVDRTYADQAPEDKLDLVRALRANADLNPVIMVGDGVNDAPALAMADVGIALAGARRDHLVRDGRRGHRGRPDRSRGRRRRDRPALAGDREAVRGRRDRTLHRGDGRGRPGVPAAGGRSGPAGGNRRRRDPERVACPATGAGVIPGSGDTVLLRDGSTAVVREFAPADLPLVEEMVGRLSPETVRLRFHSAGQRATRRAAARRRRRPSVRRGARR